MMKNQYSGIPWRDMPEMRDVLIHEYDEIDLDLVWEVIINDLPILKKSIKGILDQNS